LSATSEDLQSKLNRATKHFLTNKNTLISAFRKKIETSVRDFEPDFNRLSDNPIPVVSSYTIHGGSIDPDPQQLHGTLPNRNKNKDFVLLPMVIQEPSMQNFDSGRLYFWQLALLNMANKITLFIEYEFQLEGNECVVYRTILEQIGNLREVVVARRVVKRFSLPDDATVVSLFADVKTAVGICIDKITEKI
jgi:hypothetical protein